MKFSKGTVCVLCLAAAALMSSGCSRNTVPYSSTEKISEPPEVFSVLTIEKNSGRMNADGWQTGQSCGGFTLHEDNTVTVTVDEQEVPFEEAAGMIGCTMTENSDGSISISSPFQTSGVIVKAEAGFDTYGAVSAEESVKNHWLLKYASPSEAYSAFLRLSEDENIEYAEPDAVLVSAGYSDTKRIDSWGLEATGADSFCYKLSSAGETLPEIDVAVIDSGIYSEHIVFRNRILDGGRNYVSYSEKSAETSGTSSVTDDNGHGSHCAGIICSATNDNVKILPVKVLNNSGYGSIYSIYCGMMYAIEQDVDVMSISIGGYGKSYLYEEAIEEAEKKDIVVCVAAGNESRGNEDYYSSLSGIDSCVVVSSVDENLAPSDYSNYQNIDFAAPGKNIISVSTEGPDAAVSMSGTSMATPFAAACFADILSYNSSLSSEEAYEILRTNATDLCEDGYDEQTGWGLVNLDGIITGPDKPDEPVTAEPSVSEPEETGEPEHTTDPEASASSEPLPPVRESVSPDENTLEDSSLYAELNRPFINERALAYFVPEKTGQYSIILIPDRDKINEVISENAYMDYSLIQTEIYRVNPENGQEYYVYKDDKFSEAGQIKITLEAGQIYRLKLSAKKSELLITDKPTLAECTSDHRVHYEYTGDEVRPELNLSYNGKTLTEGTDYIVTAWNNTEPGIMLALAEGCGDYAGFRNFAVTIDGGGVKASKHRGSTVIDIRPDTPFQIADFMTYRITVDEDTLLKFHDNGNTLQLSAGFTGKYESDTYTIAGEKTEFIKKGTYFVRFERRSFNSSGSNPVPLKTAVFETVAVNRLLSDASVTIKTGINVKPEFTVEYDGETLVKGTDYSVSFTDTSAPGLYEASFKGKNDYSGRITLPYFILPEREYSISGISDGLNSISINENSCFEWIPEKDRYFLFSSSFNTADLVITDEEGNQVLCQKINGKTDAEVNVRAGKKYLIYFFSRYDFETELLLKTEGRLSDCTAEYEKMKVYSDDSSVPEFIIRDNDRVLTEGTDYTLISDGFVNDAGIREYIFRGCGDYFGELLLPVVTYHDRITSFEEYEDVVTDKEYSFTKEKIPGEKISLKLTADTEGETIYTMDLTCGSPETAEYISMFMYDSDGNFTGYGDDVKNITLSEGETVYVTVIAPYSYNTDGSIYAPESTFIFEKENVKAPQTNVLKGDSNCDGRVNVFDILTLKKFLLYGTGLSEQGRINSAVSGSESSGPSLKDLFIIKKMVIG